LPAYLIASRDAVSPTWRAGTGPSYTESGFSRAPSVLSCSLRRGRPAYIRRGLPLRRRRAGRNQGAPLVHSRARPPPETETDRPAHNPKPRQASCASYSCAAAESELPARTYSRARMRRRFRTLTRAWNWRVRRCSCRCRSTEEISNLETENAACSL